MQASFPPFAALGLHKGNGQNLQLISLGTDGRLYRPAWQSHATGHWTTPPTNALSFQDGVFSALALGTGNDGYLQVLALGADRHIYLAAWQDSSGDWHPPAAAISGPLGDPQRTYRAVAAHPGNSGFLQVFGLDTDGQIHLVIWQDQFGVWHPDGRRFANLTAGYTAMVAATGNSGNLQVLGLGADGQAYLAAWQDQNGLWHQTGFPVGNTKHRYAALAAARSSKGHLQLLGLGPDRKVYLAAWQDGDGVWHVSEKYGGPLGNESRPYATVAAHIGADRNLQVVCLGTDGKAYLAVYLDKDGAWHAPSSKSNGPLGDPTTVYRALALASGDHADKTHPGNLEVTGLGAGENDDGLPYLATSQDRDGHWHSGQPLGKARSPIVNWEAPTGQKADSGCLAFGRFWVAQGSSVVSFDIISGVPGRKLSHFGSNASPRFIQPYGDRLAVACDDGRVYAADPGTGAISVLATVGAPSWMAVYEGALYVAGSGVVRIGPDGAVSHPYGQDILGGAPTVAGGAVYVPIHSSSLGSGVDVLDAVTMSRLWSAGADGRPGPVFCDGTRLCFTTWHKSLFIYDVGSRAPITPHGKPIGLAAETDILPVFDNGLCYVALGGAVQAIDVATGKSRHTFAPVNDPVGAPVMNESGVLFYGSGGQISVIDTAAASKTVATYKTGAWPFLAAYRSGALFYADTGSAAAVRLDEAIHQFYAETNLIRDFDFSAGVGAATSTPNFQVEAALFDKDGAPRADQPVRLAVTVPTMVTYQGKTTHLSAAGFIDVMTDGAGRFRIAVAAGATGRDGTFHQGLTAPELLLTSPFMDPRMRFVVRPHGQLQQQLATITKDQLKGAKGYDEGAVLTDQYSQDDKRLTAATGAINHAAGMVRTSMADARKRDAGNMYCDPACDMAVACCMPASDPGCRVVCDQSFSFDLSEDQPHFRLLSPDDARRAAAALTAVGALGDWDDFWDKVKSGAAKVTSAVITAVADGADAAIHFVTAAGKGFVQGVISAIEQATLLVQGIFNQVATAIHRVVEAVSFLFDWGKIVDLHDQIRDQVTAAWTSLATGRDGFSYGGMKTELHSWFQTAREKVDHAFKSAQAQLGVETPLEARARTSGKPNAAVDTAQDNWLLAKCQDNVIAPTVPGSPAPHAAAESIAWPDIQLGAAVRAKFDAVFDQLGQSLSDEAKATIDGVRGILDGQSGPGILARGFAAVLEILRGLTDMAITVSQQITDLLIDLLQAVMAAVYDVMTAKITIPYVSDFYYWATKRDLTLIDLFALVTAIPAGFALGLVSREPAYASGVSPVPPGQQPGTARRDSRPITLGWMEIVAGCAQAVWGTLAGILSALDLRHVLKFGAPVDGSGLSPIAEARFWLTLIFGFGARVALLVPLVYLYFHGPTPNAVAVFLWVIPTLGLSFDFGWMWFREANPDASYVAAAVAAFLGLAMPLLGGWEFYESQKGVADGLGLGFAMAVGFSMIARGVIGLGAALSTTSPQYAVAVQYSAIAASALLLVTSGVFEVARGAVTD